MATEGKSWFLRYVQLKSSFDLQDWFMWLENENSGIVWNGRDKFPHSLKPTPPDGIKGSKVGVFGSPLRLGRLAISLTFCIFLAIQFVENYMTVCRDSYEHDTHHKFITPISGY